MSTDNCVLARVEFQGASLLPEDVGVNTWHFHQQGTVVTFPSGADRIVDMLHDFYFGGPNGGGNGIIARLSKKSWSGRVTYKLYNLEDDKPRFPFLVESEFSGNFSSAATMPREVSLVASWQAKRESGERQSRRRGRIFLPAPVVTEDDGYGRPRGEYRDLVAYRAQQLKAATEELGETWEWIVFSQKNQDHALVDNGWIDNAWDTQRRRGLAPTGRTTWS